MQRLHSIAGGRDVVLMSAIIGVIDPCARALVSLIGIAALAATMSCRPTSPRRITSGPISGEVLQHAATFKCRVGTVPVAGGTLPTSVDDHPALFASHSVKGLCVDVFEVTVKRYGDCVNVGSCLDARCSPPAAVTSNASQHPVACVTFEDASKFCEWAGGRLPSAVEAEWIKRGAGNPHEPKCGCTDAKAACVAGTSGDATRQGVFDTGGNVAEWTLTRLNGIVDPPAYWISLRAFWQHCTNKLPFGAVHASERQPYLGFRCVFEPEPEVGNGH